MLVELSIPKNNNLKFWERVEKPKPVYSISEDELKKAFIMFSIGIERPRVRVSKVKAKIKRPFDTINLPNKGGLVRLYKDTEGFYIQKVNWELI